MNIVLIEALTFGLNRLLSAANEMGVTLHLLTNNKETYFYELKNIRNNNLQVIEMDTFDTQKIIEYCNSIDNFSGLINLTDTWTNVYRDVSLALNYKGQNLNSLKICRNKSLLRNNLIKKGLSKSSYLTININDKLDMLDLSFPIIIKDPSGTGSKNVWFASNSNELKSVIRNIKNNTTLKELLIETYFKGTLYSAETISFKGQTKLIAISSRVLSDIPYFIEKAIATPLDIEKNNLEKIEPWIKEVLSSINYSDGFAHTEFIITHSNKYEIVEINPRLGGAQIGEALCQAFEYNIFKAFIEMALDIKPEIFSKNLKVKKSIGQVLLYANKQGTFNCYKDSDINNLNTIIFPYVQKGKEITELKNQSACIGVLLTAANNTELALLNAISEANKIKVIMEEDNIND